MCFILVPPTPIAAVEPLHERPVVTYSFVAVNVVVWSILNFLAAAPLFTPISSESYRGFLEWLAFVPSEKDAWTFLTYAITQQGVLHLAFNLLFLWMFGSFLEEKIGRALFLLLIVVGAVAGCVGHDLYLKIRNLNALEDVPLLGSSGVVMTILGTYLVLLPKQQFRFFCGLFGWFLRPYAVYDTIVMPAAFYIPVFVIAEEVLKLFTAQGTTVSHAAHVGGLAAGVVLGLIIRFLPGTKRAFEMEAARKEEEESRKISLLHENFRNALDEQNPEAALSILRYAEKQGTPLDLTFDDKLNLCGQLTSTGEYFVPEKTYRELLRQRLTEDQRLEVSLRLVEILLKFEKDLEACKNLLRALYRRYRGHPRMGDINQLIEQVKEAEKNLFKRPR